MAARTRFGCLSLGNVTNYCMENVSSEAESNCLHELCMVSNSVWE